MAFYLRVLGELGLRGPDQAELQSVLKQPKRLALLTYLAVASPRGWHRRDALVALLWPEQDGEHARAALRQLLYGLRQSFGEGALLTRGDEVTLDTSAFECDVWSFEEAAAQSRAETAVGIYRGPFLAGFFVSDAPDFEEWAEAERQRLARRYAAMLERMAEEAAARDPLSAVTCWRRLAAHDPLSSRVALRLMEAFEAAGEAPAAIRHAEQHAALLRTELDADPDPEVAALAERLRRRPAEAPPRTPTVAVLPFVNLTASPEDEYFSDGMTEDVIARLSLVRTLRVISRTSVMRYRKPAASMKSIAAELGASHVVEGSVRRAGNRVRIVAQLIEAEADTHLWASTFDRDITDVFAIQSDVAQSISGALRRELSPDEQRRLARRPTRDYEAYQLYLLARHHWNSATPEGFAKAEEFCEQAIQRDPGFARAWAAVAVANTMHMGGYFGVRPRDAATRVETYARRALEIDPDLAEAHMMLSFGPFCRCEWEAARRPLERALALNPNLPEAHLFYANYLIANGRTADALEAAERAYELDPAAVVVHVWVNWLLYLARRYHEALCGTERAEAQFGPGMLTHTRQQILVALGRADEAVLAMRGLCQGPADSTTNRTALAWALAAAAREEEARELLRELHDREKTEYVWPIGIACAYAHLGELDPAFAYLEKAYEDGVGWTQILYGPPFDPFRGDARLDDLIRRVNVQPMFDVAVHPEIR